MSGMSSAVIHAPSTNLVTKHDKCSDAGCKCADAVDEHARRGARPAFATPVHDHSGLRESECEKRADSIERNEPVGDTAEDEQEQCRQEYEDIDTPRVKQTPAAQGEYAGKKAVEGNGAR